uniref:Uncharacterized protein n=1 Tax=viral metagenome TaxID=1070528 RepID=A0A6C0CTH1_9ZZZZ
MGTFLTTLLTYFSASGTPTTSASGTPVTSGTSSPIESTTASDDEDASDGSLTSDSDLSSMSTSQNEINMSEFILQPPKEHISNLKVPDSLLYIMISNKMPFGKNFFNTEIGVFDSRSGKTVIKGMLSQVITGKYQYTLVKIKPIRNTITDMGMPGGLGLNSFAFGVKANATKDIGKIVLNTKDDLSQCVLSIIQDGRLVYQTGLFGVGVGYLIQILPFDPRVVTSQTDFLIPYLRSGS